MHHTSALSVLKECSLCVLEQIIVRVVIHVILCKDCEYMYVVTVDKETIVLCP